MLTMRVTGAIASPELRLWAAIIELTLLGSYKGHTHGLALTVSYFSLRPFSIMMLLMSLLAIYNTMDVLADGLMRIVLFADWLLCS
jgi:hypothetical protein